MLIMMEDNNTTGIIYSLILKHIPRTLITHGLHHIILVFSTIVTLIEAIRLEVQLVQQICPIYDIFCIGEDTY